MNPLDVGGGVCELKIIWIVGAHPVGLVIGLSTIIPAAILEAWRARPLIESAATGLAPDDPAWDRWNPWLARERAEDEGAER